MKKSTKGFTLVELIVVIGVLLVLAVIAVAAYRNVQVNARISANRSSLQSMASVMNNAQGATGQTIGDTGSNLMAKPGSPGPWSHVIPEDPSTGAEEMVFAADASNVHPDAWDQLDQDDESGMWYVKPIDRSMVGG